MTVRVSYTRLKVYRVRHEGTQAEIAERVDASRTPFFRRANGGFVPLYGTGAEARARTGRFR